MVKIIAATVFNRPDFIPIQLESIKRHVKCDFEYIVFDNAKIDNGFKYSEQIKSTCKDLNVECVEVPYSKKILDICTTASINENGYTHGAYACYYPIQWCFTEFLNNIDHDMVYIIDSDMFFLNDINLYDLMKGKDLVYIPSFRQDIRQNPMVEYIWNMFCGFNFKQDPTLKNLNWSNGINGGQMCDVGGGTYTYLLNKPSCIKEIIEEFNIYTLGKTMDGNIEVCVNINGNIDYNLLLKPNFDLIGIRHSGGVKFLPDRSFVYEKDRGDYSEYLVSMVKRVIGIIKKAGISETPNPLRLGFIKRAIDDYIFGIHYRSSSNYLDYSTDEYNIKKTEMLKKILNQ